MLRPGSEAADDSLPDSIFMETGRSEAAYKSLLETESETADKSLGKSFLMETGLEVALPLASIAGHPQILEKFPKGLASSEMSGDLPSNDLLVNNQIEVEACAPNTLNVCEYGVAADQSPELAMLLQPSTSFDCSLVDEIGAYMFNEVKCRVGLQACQASYDEPVQEAQTAEADVANKKAHECSCTLPIQMGTIILRSCSMSSLSMTAWHS